MPRHASAWCHPGLAWDEGRRAIPRARPLSHHGRSSQVTPVPCDRRRQGRRDCHSGTPPERFSRRNICGCWINWQILPLDRGGGKVCPPLERGKLCLFARWQTLPSGGLAAKAGFRPFAKWQSLPFGENPLQSAPSPVRNFLGASKLLSCGGSRHL